MVHIFPILTDILTGHNVSSLTPRSEIVDFVVNLQTSDTTSETGVQTQEVGHVLYVPHTSEVERLIEGNSGEQAL